MGNTWGKNIKISIFGESHGPAIGMVLDGLPPGFEINWDEVRREMGRRAPGNGPLSTPRKEADEWELLSGCFEEKTTGAPLAVLIRNQNTKSSDYQKGLLRPGHADLGSLYKFKGYSDYRGGGHSSGRLTAPLVLAGAIAKQILLKSGIAIGARILSIHQVTDAPAPAEGVLDVSKKPFPVFNEEAAAKMQEAILAAKRQGDSVGGVIECCALGAPGGWGDPFFHSMESQISSMLFSIPAVKGVEFGDGFSLARMTGSQANDQMTMEDGRVRLASNHSGGILGGITSGAPLLVRVAVKPTPTIFKTQTTVDFQKGETVEASFTGRHDPCIVPRAVPVVEAALALCLLDHYLESSHRKEEIK